MKSLTVKTFLARTSNDIGWNIDRHFEFLFQSSRVNDIKYSCEMCSSVVGAVVEAKKPWGPALQV